MVDQVHIVIRALMSCIVSLTNPVFPPRQSACLSVSIVNLALQSVAAAVGVHTYIHIHVLDLPLVPRLINIALL